jgi:enoyl-[acyl-carrier protein] reductase I
MNDINNVNLLKGKKGLVTGVANDRSIAWGIAKTLKSCGAEIALSYQGEILKKRVNPLAESIDCKHLIECDVSNDESLDGLLKNVADVFGGEIDFVIHSIAFAERSDLSGKYSDISRENFLKAMDISCYSFVRMASQASKFMKNGGSIVAMSYLGSTKVIPNYNVMGVAKAALEASNLYVARDLGVHNIRSNIVSPGAIKTLAASAIGGFGKVLSFQEENSPLRKNATQEDVGQATAFLVSDLSKSITGQTIYVDGGYNIVGMPESLAN